MNIGAGITLTVVGLILLLGVVEIDIPWVNEYALGVLLTLAGVVAVVLTLTVYRRGIRGTRVVERRVERDFEDPEYL